MAQISPVLRTTDRGLMHWCPGCEAAHVIYTILGANNGPIWMFDSNVTKPTFSPSVRHRWGRFFDPNFKEESPDESGQCHYFIRAGNIEFCGDCTHGLAGQTVALPELPEHLRDA